MRMQNSQANCGPTAVQNGLVALGLTRSIDELEKLLGCTATQGTSGPKMLKGLYHIEELQPRKIEESREEIAHLRLDAALRSGRPVILCVDNLEHYVCAIGRLGTSRVIIADSADSELVLVYTWSEAMRRWESQSKKAYWGLVL